MEKITIKKLTDLEKLTRRAVKERDKIYKRELLNLIHIDVTAHLDDVLADDVKYYLKEAARHAEEGHGKQTKQYLHKAISIYNQ